MKTPHKILLSLCLALTLCLPAQADTQHQLKKIMSNIMSIKKLLSRKQTETQRIEGTLKRSETRINAIEIKVRKLKTQQARNVAELAHLKKQHEKYEEKHNREKLELQKQLDTIYKLNHVSRVQLFLAQDNINRAERIMTYYHYLIRYRAELLHSYQITLDEIAENEKNILQKQNFISQLMEDMKHQHAELARNQRERRSILSKLHSHIHAQQNKLKRLEEQKENMTKLLKRLQREQKLLAGGIAFPKLKGKLHWPVAGTVENNFGKAIDHSQLTWSGVVIKAPEGKHVKAISAGKVVFAQWVAGYGLLMIINHGNGYMSLYGRNHILLKQAGDMVNAGDVIAMSGNSGGYKEPALYFAIRHNSQPVNPAIWCKRRYT